MLSSHDTNRRVRFIAAARTSLAARHAADKRFENVLATMGWCDERAVADFDGLVEHLNFGRDTYAWGLVMLALNQTQRPETALELLERLKARGIAVTDSLCHLAIEACSALGRPEDAEKLFQDLLDRQVEPKERTVGSLLRVLTSAGPSRRSCPNADPARIQELVALVSDPSPRFLTASLVAFANVGYVDGAETSFEAVAEHCEGNIPDERAFMVLMRSYASQIIREVPPNTPESQISKWYADCVRRADKLWSRYLSSYGAQAPGPDQAYARRTIFPKYILIKALGFELSPALELLREALESEQGTLRTYFKPGILHFAALFSGIERACDAQVLQDALEVMSRAGIPLNDSCLASAVGTLVFHGSPAHAAKLTAVCAPSLLGFPPELIVIRNRNRLLRRLQLLEDALEQGPLAETHEWAQHRSVLNKFVGELTETLRDLAV
jgi:pentatricopeptide repeat protein